MKPFVNTLIQASVDRPLVSAMQLLQAVETPPYIPLLEVMTLDQISKYYGVQLGICNGLYKNSRSLFANHICKICASDVEPYAISSHAENYPVPSKEFMFANGVKATICVSQQIVFNARGVLLFAVLIETRREHDVASHIGNEKVKKIVNLLRDETFSLSPKCPILQQWFYYRENIKPCPCSDDYLISAHFLPPEQAKRETEEWLKKRKQAIYGKNHEQEESVEIPLKEPKSQKEQKTQKPHKEQKAQIKVDVETKIKITQGMPRRNSRNCPVKQYSLDGVLLNEYDSQTDAFLNTKVSTALISKCCRNERPSAGGYIWKYA